MGKPKLFVSLNNGFDLRIITDKLDKKFDIHYWPHMRHLTREEMKANVKGVFGIICQVRPIIDSEIIDAAGENLRVVVTISAGYDHLDIKALKAKGIRVGYLGCLEAMNITVAEHAIGLLLATARQIGKDDRALRKNVDARTSWINIDWSGHLIIWDSVIGIIGCGNIGVAIIKRLQPFSPKQFLYSSRNRKSEVDAIGGEWKSVDDVCKNSDFIIVTVQLNKETYHLLNRARLDSMKPNAVIVNVARGDVIDEKALVELLRDKRIAGAGLDVYEEEPIQSNNPLLSLDNAVITPHVGGASDAVWSRQMDRAAENILAVYENREMPSEL